MDTPLLTAGTDYVYCMDAERFLRMLPTGSVDIVVTSPPYNLRASASNWSTSKHSNWAGMKLRHGYLDHTDDLPHEQYVAWQRRLLTEMLRVSSSAVFYNQKWRTLDKQLYMCNDILEGFPIRQIVIWDRGSGHNANGYFFIPCYEVIYVLAKPDFKLVNGMQGLGDVWHINPETDNEHPAPFPIQIPLRCIEASGAQTVADPFMGSGTTADAARRLGRRFIGCDISERYVRMANERLLKPVTLPMFAA